MIESDKPLHPKQKILIAAFSLLKRNTVDKLSSASIAREAGISKSGFFHHFATIEDFYLYFMDQMMEWMEYQLQSRKSTTLEELIRNSTLIVMKTTKESPELMLALTFFADKARFSAMHKHKIEQLYEIMTDKWSLHLEEVLPAYIDASQRKQIAELIDVFFTGISHHYLFSNDEAIYKMMSENFIAMLNDQIAKQA